MTDAAWCATLAALNAVVAYLNARAYGRTGELRDLWAAVAWLGSTAYWLVRAAVAMG